MTRQLTYVVRWDSDSEGTSYDAPSMIVTITVDGQEGGDVDQVHAGLPEVARRIVKAYPTGPSGEHAMEASWVFEEDAMCVVEAVFEGAPRLHGGWKFSELIGTDGVDVR